MDIAVGYKTYPHIDMFEAGLHAGRLLLATLRGELRPALAWRQLPIVTHTLCSGTGQGAMQRAVAAAMQAESEGMLAVSVLAGFGLADIAAPCLSVLAVADGDAQAAQATANRIAAQIWQERAGFVYESEPLSASITRAAQLAEGEGKGPVLLLDHGDNCMSGGTCDDMQVLREAMRQGLSGIAVGPINDAWAVAELIEAGIGAQVTLPVGNKIPLTQLDLHREPLTLSGRVAAISDGEYTISGPTYTGQRIHMGPTVLLDTGAALVVVTGAPQEHWDLGIFTHIGVDPHAQRFLLLKSRMYCRPVFVPIARAVVECDGGGVTSSRYAQFPFRRLARPVYPMDEGMVWEV